MKIKVKKLLSSFILLTTLFSLNGCSDAEDLLDLALDPPKRQPIDQSRVGVNNFFVDSVFGTIPQQFLEIRDVLGIRHIRILMAWTNDVQPSPSGSAFFGFFDEIINNIPPGIDVIIVVAHAPDWMLNSDNWTSGGNPRTTWVDRWLTPVVTRYADRPGVIGFEVWNEPDLPRLPGDVALGLENPDLYQELLFFGSSAIRSIAPTELILNAATEAINQDFPNHLDYNKRLWELGAGAFVDVWNVHYYSSNFETVITNNGVADFLNSLGLPIWITESGEQGPNNQLGYVETAWPFLREKIPAIDRIYYFQFGETTPIDNNFGLRTTDPAFPVSDLYVALRDT